MTEKKSPQYAHFGHRFAAMMIDNLVLGIILSPIFAMVFGVPEYTDEQIKQDLQTDGIYGLLGLMNMNKFLAEQLVLFGITIFFWLRFAGTPGKRLLKLRVVDATTGKNLTMLQSVVRYFGYLIASFPMGLGFIWVLLDEKNQGWHDKLANSVVIKDEAYLSLEQENPYDSNNTDNDNTFVA